MQDRLAIGGVERMIGGNALRVTVVQRANGTGVNPLGGGECVLLAKAAPVIGETKFQDSDEVEQVRGSFGKLDGLMPVIGLDHRFALLQAQVRGVTCGGVIASEFRREVWTAALLKQLGHLANEALGFEEG